MSEDKHCRMMPRESAVEQACLAAGHAQRGRIGDLAGHELPIKIPAAKTKAPPTTTWKAA
jgi:hypothetical protein